MLDTQRLLTLWGTLSLLYAYYVYHNMKRHLTKFSGHLQPIKCCLT